MVVYHGGKRQYGNRIAKVIVASLPQDRQFSMYYEPFCGMLGVFRHVLASTIKLGCFRAYLGSDLHASVISMWQAVQQGWLPNEDPDSLTQETAEELMLQPSPSPLKAYFGFSFFYAGQFFQGKFRPSASRHRLYIDEFKYLCELFKSGTQVRFTHGDYRELMGGVTNAVIYLDPPYYKKSCKYRDEQKNWFPKVDHKEFWELCRILSKDNIVFVSEQTYPDDFVSIASFTRVQNLHPDQNMSERDHLIVHKDTLPLLSVEKIQG